MGSPRLSIPIGMSSESTEAAMNRVMQQLNSQGLFNVTESAKDNPYDFTYLHRKRDTLNNDILESVIQETPRASIFDSRESIGEEAMHFNQSSIVCETQRTIQGFEVGERVGLVHSMENIMVAIAKISSTAAIRELHNRLLLEGFYKVFIEEVLVDEAPLMITNVNDDPLQLFVRDALGTLTAWKRDRIQRLPSI